MTTETTGHAESVEIMYDPTKITYGTLLRIFFSVAHDPTQKNRQGPDVGTSYRSAIFFTNSEQERVARAYIHQLDAEHVFPAPIVTEVSPLEGFYKAEDYHQDYATKNPNNPYIQICDVPKTKALEARFPDLFVPYKGHLGRSHKINAEAQENAENYRSTLCVLSRFSLHLCIAFLRRTRHVLRRFICSGRAS